ncbi:hypothetical protein [Neisseria dentiae]|uniref:hypothetical protein n=1 Tax=Neisseria dentiae TaxID=194197 RepID=UPI00211BDF53|nr:hypothetical protein [Neisseria dentiae]MCQ9326020.1 hypothetical protein [Neisseria dentiae]
MDKESGIVPQCPRFRQAFGGFSRQTAEPKTFAKNLGSVVRRLAKRFFEKKSADARQKAQQDWTSCEHFERSRCGF